MYYVYILQSLRDGNIYTGFTSNLKKRFAEHQAGLVDSTKNRHPLQLVYYEAYTSKKDAMAREKYLKNGGKAKQDLKDRLKYSLSRGVVQR